MTERKEFYRQLKSFLKELVVVFPENDDDLLTVTTSINLAIIDDDANEMVYKFYNTLNPVEHEIHTRSDSIFDKMKWEISTYEYNLFQKLKTGWSTFTENNKQVIWDYIQVLYGLSKLIFR
jgi:hypothetical protein